VPYLEFECAKGHRQEVFFRSISAGAEVNEVSCIDTTCMAKAVKVPSVPMQAHLYGSPDGYYKPSPSKRWSNKTISQKEGNGRK
jgi:hypothetical protein